MSLAAAVDLPRLIGRPRGLSLTFVAAIKRRLQPELMDDPGLPRDQHEHALAGLARLNRMTRIAADMYGFLRAEARLRGADRLKILDVASGSGDLPIAWAKSARRDGLEFDITAVDISPVAIEQQQAGASRAGVELTSQQLDCLQPDWPSGFDVVTNSLFLHHLERPQAVDIVRSMMGATRGSVLICDLERSWINRWLVGIGSRLVTRSPIVHVDAIRSVEGAYTRSEMNDLIAEATGCQNAVRRLLPCRMIARLVPSPDGETPGIGAAG